MACPTPLRPLFILLAAACLTAVPPALRAQAPDAKMQELAKKFAEGKELFVQARYPEAAEVFDGIIAQVPEARGSLLLAGGSYLEMGQYKKAADRLNAFIELEPDDVQGLMWAIQANQAMDRDIKVRKLIAKLQEVRASGKPLPGSDDGSQFIRQRQKLDDGSLLVVNEYFDYKAEPYTLWSAEKISPDGITQQVLALIYDEDQTQEARAKVAGRKGAENVEVFLLIEYVMKNGEVEKMNVYKQEFERPAYASVRKMFLDTIANPPTPIVSKDVKGG